MYVVKSVRLLFKAKQIGLSKQTTLVDKTILGEKLVKVVFPTAERLTFRQPFS